jgi:trimeric autotransporter adhesin
MLKPILVISFVAASATACSGSGTSSGTVGSASAAVTGHVAPGTGSDATGFGGPSAVKSSVTVSAATIAADGTTVSVATGPVAADGTFTLDVPVHAGPTLFQALDASGTVVVSAVLEDTLVEGKAAIVQPLSTESSVEAAVLVTMAAAGTEVAEIDIPAIRARIDAATAMVVQGDAAGQVNQATADVKALAVATLAAQKSQQASLTAAAVDWAAYVAAELQAADALTAALDANTAAAAQASADFTAALAALDAQFGLSPANAAQAVTNASASAQAALAAEQVSTALTDAFDHVQAMRESVALTAAMTEAFTTAVAPAAVMTQLQAAGTSLTTQVGAATNAAGVSAAFDAWRTTVRGTTTGTGGLVATLFGPTISATPAYVTTITTLLSNDAALETTLAASAVASESAAGVVDATKLAGLVSQAYATFDSGIQMAVTGSTVGFVGADAALMSSVFVSSKGSF